MSNRQFLLLLVPFILLVVIGFLIYPNHPPEEGIDSDPLPRSTVILAMMGNKPGLVEEELGRLTDFLNKFLVEQEITVRPYVAYDRSEIRDVLADGEIDFYLGSPFPVYSLVSEGLLQGVARQWRDEVAEYNSLFVVSRESEIRAIEDLSGKHIAFEDPGSSSSYFLPATELYLSGFKLIQEDASPDEGDMPYVFYSFSNWDQHSINWVLEGRVDVAAVNSIFYNTLEAAQKSQVRVIHESPKIPRHILAARTGLDPRIEDVIVDILLDMETSQEGRNILKTFYETRRFDLIPYEQDLKEAMFRKLDLLPWEH